MSVPSRLVSPIIYLQQSVRDLLFPSLLLGEGDTTRSMIHSLVQDESYEGEYRALQDNLLAAQNDYLEDREGELGKRIGDLVAPVAQKIGEAAAKMIQ